MKDELVEVLRDGDWLVASWHGDVDMSNAAEFQERAMSTLRNTDSGLTVDIGGVTYIDSAGIRSLLNMRRMLEERQQKLSVVLPAGSVLTRALEVGGVVAVIPTFPSLQAAEAGRED